MSDHLLSQEQIDALVEAEKTKEKKLEKDLPKDTSRVSREAQRLFRELEPKLGEALALLTGSRASTACLSLDIKEATDLGDLRYLISLGSTESNVDVLVYVDEDAAASILRQISEQPDQTELFAQANMEVFGKAIEVLENEFSKQVSVLTNRHFTLSLALPKGLSNLQEFLDPMKDYLVLEYTLEWNEVEVGMLGFILKNDDLPSIFTKDVEGEVAPSIDALIQESMEGQDTDIFSHFMDDFEEPEQQTDEIIVQPVQFGNLKGKTANDSTKESNLEIILDLPVTITVELGRTSRTLEDILNLKPGSVVELDRLAGEPVDILANGVFVAKGEVVVIDETFGVKITEIASRKQRLSRIK
ncbi:MAG: flagellar motor switch protein FliN [Firmicutes bacterium]|nr:flagellar motor switch protein FliN [Bacillota bacterium]